MRALEEQFRSTGVSKLIAFSEVNPADADQIVATMGLLAGMAQLESFLWRIPWPNFALPPLSMEYP
jgi:hypothetical protein